MDSTHTEVEHDSFNDVLEIQERINGRRTTRIVYIAHCKCGFSTHKSMARVEKNKGKWTRDSNKYINEAKKEVHREYLLHLK